MRYQAWLVDLDGTLYHARLLRPLMAAELLLWDARSAPIIWEFRREHERLRADLSCAVDDPYRLQLARTAERLGKDVTVVAEAVDRWMVRRACKWLRLVRRRWLLAEIAQFRREGGKTALVSDYPARAKLAALGAREHFDVVVANGESCGPGRLKPWPDGCLEAARRLETDPSRCLVIGDREEADGQAARRAGMAFRRVF